MSSAPRERIVDRLRLLDSCLLSDALDVLNLSGVVRGIGPLWEGGRIAGSVHTVLLREAEGPPPPGSAHLGARAIEAAGRGEIVVVANGGRVGSAAWGGLLSAAASVRGIIGVVVDGAARDVDEASALAFPVYARGATPVSARGRTVEDDTDVPVMLSDVMVEAHDLLLADRSGVVVIGREVAGEVVATAEDLGARERSLLAELEAGRAVTEVMGRRYETMLQAAGSEDGSGHPDRGGGDART